MRQSPHSYFDWLTKQVNPLGARYMHQHMYQSLFLKLFSTEFVWTISGDDNRVKDALDLRREFTGAGAIPVQFPEFISILEVLVALSRRLAFLTGGEAPDWAWTLIENLGLAKCHDPLSTTNHIHIDEVLDALVWRTYKRNGQGGFFPLQKRTREDQRKIELWYQMQAYVSEIQEPE